MLGVLDATCLTLGQLLADLAGDESDLPFTVEECRRLRAVFLAYSLLGEDMLEGFPRPWQALWTIPAGRIGRGMPRHATAAKRVSGAELLATRLVESDPNDVNSDVVSALVEWLHERTESQNADSRHQP